MTTTASSREECTYIKADYKARRAEELSVLKGDRVQVIQGKDARSMIEDEEGALGWIPSWLLSQEPVHYTEHMHQSGFLNTAPIMNAKDRKKTVTFKESSARKTLLRIYYEETGVYRYYKTIQLEESMSLDEVRQVAIRKIKGDAQMKLVIRHSENGTFLPLKPTMTLAHAIEAAKRATTLLHTDSKDKLDSSMRRMQKHFKAMSLPCIELERPEGSNCELTDMLLLMGIPSRDPSSDFQTPFRFCLEGDN